MFGWNVMVCDWVNGMMAEDFHDERKEKHKCSIQKHLDKHPKQQVQHAKNTVSLMQNKPENSMCVAVLQVCAARTHGSHERAHWQELLAETRQWLYHFLVIVWCLFVAPMTRE